MKPDIASVDYHFDVMCPYAYQTAKWIRDVRRQNGIEINWKFFSLEEINRVNGWTTDTPSGSETRVFVSTVLAELLTRVDAGADPRLPGIVALLASWDFQQLDEDADGHYDSPAVSVFNRWWPILGERIFADDLGAAFDDFVVANLIGRLLDDDPALPLRHDYLDGETLEEAVTGSLIDALDALTAEFASADPVKFKAP